MTQFEAKDEQQMFGVAKEIASQITAPSCVYLHGELGAGKTTLAKGIINSMGYAAAVTSPTYNLIQEYPLQNSTVYHMDLYRLDDASELEYLALGDLWNERSIFLIEWPENGQGYLPDCDYQIDITKLAAGREIDLRKVSK